MKLAYSYTYLASPYSHKDPTKMAERYEHVLDATAYLLLDRVWVFSPIVHCHELARRYNLPRDFTFWQDYNITMLRAASYLVILAIEGWTTSTGVKGEIAEAKKLGLPISLLVPKGKRYDHWTYDESNPNSQASCERAAERAR